EGRFRADWRALPHGRLGPLDIVMPPARDRLDVADGQVLEFLLHRLIGLFFAATSWITTERYGVRRADGRGRRHCGDARGDGNETTGTGRSRARRSDVNHDWHSRLQEALHDCLGRVEQAARRVELNDQTLRVLR